MIKIQILWVEKKILYDTFRILDKNKNLYFDFKTGIRPSLTILLGDQNPLTVRKILLEYLKEDTEKENETFTDTVSRLLKLQ